VKLLSETLNILQYTCD